MKRKNLSWAMIALVIVGFNLSCSEEAPVSGGDGPDGEKKSQYVIAASSKEATYLLQTDKLDEGKMTIVNNGMEVDAATAWVFYKNKYAYRLQYNQGNAGLGTSYQLNTDGKLEERNIKFEVQNRFTTYGTYGNYIVMAASGATNSYASDNRLPKYGVTFTIIDAEQQKLRTETVVTENLVDNGEYFTVSGIVDVNNKLYTALCPQGLSPYAVAQDPGYVKDPSLVEEGAVSATQYPDNVWVAIYNGLDFNNPKILHDTRISYATSRNRSQFYSTIVPDKEGNVYVFSSSHAQGQSGIQKTTKPSGVIRIKAGTEEFDPDYYCDIEKVADGRRLYQVWYVTEDYFLLRMYADVTESSSANSDTRRLGIFKASDKSFRWVEDGFPAKELISSIGKFPCMEGGLAYVPVVTNDGNQPTVYVIDPVSATAKKGVEVNSTEITAVGKLQNE